MRCPKADNTRANIPSNALDWLAAIGCGPVYGARPLKRAIQRELETPIAKGILGGQFTAGHTEAVDMRSKGEKNQLRILQLSKNTPAIPIGKGRRDSTIQVEQEIARNHISQSD